jgi:hypothetical protein
VRAEARSLRRATRELLVFQRLVGLSGFGPVIAMGRTGVRVLTEQP